jgi:hypothetical protein
LSYLSLRPSGRAVLAAFGLLLMVAVTGCAGQQSASAPPPPVPTTIAAPAPSSRTSQNQVRFPWKPGKPQLGIQVYWSDTTADSASTVLLKAARMVAYVRSLDANSITISFPLFTTGPDSSSVFGNSTTPSPARLDSVIRTAQAAGLRITLRPTLDEASLLAASPNDWRGNIEPDSPSAWFASYSAFLAPYFELAQKDRVQTFVVGTELTSLQDEPGWASLVSKAKALYKGELTYAANWDSYVEGSIPIPVTRIGVDAYPPLKNLDDNATVGQLVAGWDAWLDQKTTGSLPDTLFYEVDAPAVDGAYGEPATYGYGGQRNYQVQVNWFKAACTVARQRDASGLYWWRYDFQQDPATADPAHDRSDSWVGRPAAQTIKQCFDSWAAADY